VHKGKPKSGKADTTLTIDDKDMVEVVSYYEIYIFFILFYSILFK